MEHFNLEELSNGELTQQINRELETVANNIYDPNTDAKTARKVTVTITMKPNEKRDFITTSITAKSTLAPTLGVVTAFAIGKDLNTGKVQMAEIGNQVPGQMRMQDMEPLQPVQETEQVVDQSTGEIFERPVRSNNVVDLRKPKEA